MSANGDFLLGSLPSKWRLQPLRNVTSKIGSGSTPRGGASVYVSDGPALIRSQNVHDNYFRREGLVRLDEGAAHALRGVTVQAGDVLMNITGDSILRCCIVPDDVLPARVNQHVSIIRSDGTVIPQIIQKYLSLPAMKEFMLGHSAGGTRKAVTKGHIEGFMVPIPPPDEQQEIASVFEMLDAKIDSNRRSVRLLTALAAAEFDGLYSTSGLPVRANAAGELDRAVSEGWRATVLSEELADVVGGDWGASELSEDATVKVRCIRGADMPDLQAGGFGDMPIRYVKARSATRRSLRDGDLVIEISGGSPTQSTGRTVLVSSALLDQLDCPLVCSNFCRSLRPESREASHFLYLWLSQLYLNDEFLQFENGTTGIKNLAFAGFAANYPLAIPSGSRLHQFDQTVAPLFAHAHALGRESARLDELRKVLTIGLLSGLVRADNLETLDTQIDGAA